MNCICIRSHICHKLCYFQFECRTCVNLYAIKIEMENSLKKKTFTWEAWALDCIRTLVLFDLWSCVFCFLCAFAEHPFLHTKFVQQKWAIEYVHVQCCIMFIRLSPVLHKNLRFLLAAEFILFYGRIRLTKFQTKYGKYILQLILWSAKLLYCAGAN